MNIKETIIRNKLFEWNSNLEEDIKFEYIIMTKEELLKCIN